MSELVISGEANPLAPASVALIARAASVDRACALLDGATPAELCTALVDCADHGDWLNMPETARWNLLWVWAELSCEVDLFSARALWSALGRLFHRQLRRLDDSDAVMMVFDFFFRRASHPLVPLQVGVVLTLFGRLLEDPSLTAQKAALHGLGHLIALLTQESAPTPILAEVYATIDRFTPSPALIEYVTAARRGTIE